MKKKSILCDLSLLLILALAVSAWFWTYHHRKSNDNLPSLASLSQIREEEITDFAGRLPHRAAGRGLGRA